MKRAFNQRTRIFAGLTLGLALLVPVALAQKSPPPTPAPPPTSNPTGRPTNTPPVGSQPNQPREDMVLFIQGRVATADGTPVPTDAMVERICNSKVRQQVHASSRGEFTMQMGSKTDSMVDATGDGEPFRNTVNGQDPAMGIPRRELANCDLRASIPGFSSNIVSLVDLSGYVSSVNVGDIVVQRRNKVEGMTLNASAYKAPTDARKAYEKGLEAERKGKSADARKYFEKAVEIYPKYTSAWFQLGTVLKQDHQTEPARAAFEKATTLDGKFLPPYLSLAQMAYEAEKWNEVLMFTGHILDLDALNHVSGYVLDLDPANYTEAYFYNAFANYKLNKFEEAEKSGLKAERVDLPTRFPQVHLMLADIFSRKKNYGTAISEIRTYLELVPQANDAAQLQEQVAKLEKLNTADLAGEKPVTN